MSMSPTNDLEAEFAPETAEHSAASHVQAAERLAPARFKPGFAASVQHGSLDALLETVRTGEWSGEVMQIGRGPFHGSAELVETREVQLCRTEWLQGLVVRGTSPSRATHFGLTSQGSGNTWENGKVVDSTDICIRGSGEAYDLRTLETHRRLVVCVSDDRLHHYATSVLGILPEDLRRTGRLELPGASTAGAIAEALENLLDWACRSPSLLADRRVGEMFSNTVLNTMLPGAAPAAQPVRRLETYRVARRAEEFIRENASEPISVQELCIETGLPERTLFHVFQKHFGQSPKAFLKTARLNGVYRDLSNAAPGTTVTDVATRWGFFHFGRFATYYREAFGEPPSATLRRLA